MKNIYQTDYIDLKKHFEMEIQCIKMCKMIFEFMAAAQFTAN